MGETLLCADVNMSLGASSQCNSFSKARHRSVCIIHTMYPQVFLRLRWYHPPLLSFMGHFMRIGISVCIKERCLPHLFIVFSEISFCSLMQNRFQAQGKAWNGSLCNTLEYFTSSLQHASVHASLIIQKDRCRPLPLWQEILGGCFNRREQDRNSTEDLEW